MRNYMYIFVMAATTYLIRVIPLAFLRREIKNRTFRSFLTYVPYVTLAVMTFPAILESTEDMWISAVVFGAAMIMGYLRVSLFAVSMGCCLLVFLLQVAV